MKKNNFKLILLGCEPNQGATYLHHLEAIYGVPYRKWITIKKKKMAGKKVQVILIRYFAKKNDSYVSNFNLIFKHNKQLKKYLKTKKIKYGRSYSIYLKDLHKIGLSILKKDKYYFVKKNNSMELDYIIKKLSEISKKFPNSIALIELKKKYSYKKFFNIISNFSKQISLLKKKPVVVIIGEKDILSYTSILGVLMSGGTYIPLSSNLPEKRVIKIIKKTKANIIICKSNKVSIYKKIFPKKKFLTEKNLSSTENNSKIKLKNLNELAYIMFTSGSTGEPKGVCVSRNSLNHYVRWLILNFKIKKDLNVLQFQKLVLT